MPALRPGAVIRDAKVMVSFTPKEKEAAVAISQSMGLPLAQWVRVVVLGAIATAVRDEQAEVSVAGFRRIPPGGRVIYHTAEEPTSHVDYSRHAPPEHAWDPTDLRGYEAPTRNSRRKKPRRR
jgi:hypothetical protein